MRKLIFNFQISFSISQRDACCNKKQKVVVFLSKKDWIWEMHFQATIQTELWKEQGKKGMIKEKKKQTKKHPTKCDSFMKTKSC